jgi:PAS domain S-box-containing protein
MTFLDDVTTHAVIPLNGPAPSTGACLILISTASPGAIGRAFPLTPGEHVLGRGSEASIRIDDHGVSRRHARIVSTPEGACRVMDLQSTNGTYVNGMAISSPVELREGDRLQIGTGTVLRFSTRDQLEPREEQLRQALSAARVGIWDWNASTGVVTWSEQVDRMLGLPAGKLSGRSMGLEEVVHPADLQRVKEALAAALEKRAHLELEYRIEPAGSGYRWISCKGDVLSDLKGSPTRITGTVMDITGRMQAEQELRRHALIFESFYDGVVITDLSGRIVDMNPSAERMFGRTKAESLGQTLFSVLHPSETDALTAKMLSTLEQAGRWTGEVEFQRRDGTGGSCECVAVPLKDAEGRTIACIMVHRDITERKNLQARLVMADRLASVGTLGAGVAHEINNPLAYMLVNLHLIRSGLANMEAEAPPGTIAPLQELVQETTEGAERIASIVQDLKTFARGEADSRLGPVDVRRAVELACKMADNMLRHRARLLLDFENVPLVEANESRLGQVFLNLLLNAAQAIPEGEPADRHEVAVRIRASAPGHVVVEVRDTGMGMTPEVLSRVFDPFFTTKPIGEGTGLGLSICHGIIESMGGTISAESTPGKGSTFRVVLRMAPQETEALTRTGSRLALPSANAPRARVLVVDDEPNVTSSLQRVLSSEHEVATANSGHDALKMLSSDRGFDVILCDVMMPGMTGMDLYAELARAAPEVTGRVVFMTGGAFTPRAVSFLQGVPNPKIGKPLNLEELRMLITRRAGEAQR